MLLRFGDKKLRWLKRLQSEGHTVEALEDAPELSPYEKPFLEAFLFLSRYRRSLFSVGYIHLSEITQYLDELLIRSPELRLEYIRMISALDEEFVSFQRKKAEAAKEKEEDPTRGRS